MLAIVVMLASLSFACADDKTGPTPVLTSPPTTTFPMPPLKPNAEMGWLMADGQRSKLLNYRGKVLVLDFYATWCVPCRKSIPHLIALQNKRAPEGLQIVGLNVGGADDRIKVASFARELGVTYPLGFPDKELTDFFLSDNQTIPQTFVFGREGQLIKRLIGFEGTAAAELDQAIETGIETK